VLNLRCVLGKYVKPGGHASEKCVEPRGCALEKCVQPKRCAPKTCVDGNHYSYVISKFVSLSNE